MKKHRSYHLNKFKYKNFPAENKIHFYLNIIYYLINKIYLFITKNNNNKKNVSHACLIFPNVMQLLKKPFYETHFRLLFSSTPLTTARVC